PRETNGDRADDRAGGRGAGCKHGELDRVDGRHGARGGGSDSDRDADDDHCTGNEKFVAATLHVHGSNRYPTPQTVMRWRGADGSCSIFSRNRRMWTVTVAVSPYVKPQTCSRSSSRRNAWRGDRARNARRSNSRAVNVTGTPSTVTSRAVGST